MFLVLSGLATGASWLCYFRALQQLGQAGQVAPVDKLSVVFVAIIGALFLGERLSTMGWGGGRADRRRRRDGGGRLVPRQRRMK